MELKGTFYKGTYLSRGEIPGISFDYGIYVSDGADDLSKVALIVDHDGLSESHAEAMERLRTFGEAPAFVMIGVVAGEMFPTVEGGRQRGMRMLHYDIFSPQYASFIIDEFVPAMREQYGFGFSDDPDMHLAEGSSSGGISAFAMTWFRNDYFRRTYISSPSFLSMGGGRAVPDLIRKVETKPIRIYMEYSQNEPDAYFGATYPTCLDTTASLDFAGYEYYCRYFPREGHGSRYCSVDSLVEGYKYLWRNWETEKVTVKKVSDYVERVVDFTEDWEKTDFFPQKETPLSPDGRAYTFDDHSVYLGGEEVASGFDGLSSVAVSADGWRFYTADRRRGSLGLSAISPGGTLQKRMQFAVLHQSVGFEFPGAFDMCIDDGDRVWCATEMGIQVVRTFGLVDVILPLPGLAIPREVAFDGDVIYARTDCGIYKRKTKTGRHGDGEVALRCVGYYD